jgi:hypothetical protein
MIIPTLAAILLGSSAAPAATPQTVTEQLIVAENNWMEAMKARDRSRLEPILAREFTLGAIDDPARAPLARENWMRYALNDVRVKNFRFDHVRATVVGDSGVVQAVFTWEASFNGKDFSDTMAVLDYWVMREGRWQIVSSLAGPYKPDSKGD